MYSVHDMLSIIPFYHHVFAALGMDDSHHQTSENSNMKRDDQEDVE